MLPFYLEVIHLLPHYGHYIRILHSATDQAMTNALNRLELTAAQGHLLGYLSHRKEPPCPRDIEEDFQLSHPTVSGLLFRLEKKGFIEIRPDKADRRCKRVYILPKGQELEDAMHNTIMASEAQMTKDFTDEEKEQFARFLVRAIHNMGETTCKRKHKEE